MWNCIAPVTARIQDSTPAENCDYYAGTTAAAPGALAAFFRGFFIAVFLAATFTEAFTAAFLTAVFFAALFLAAWNAAQRFFVASAIARLPAALSFRLRFGPLDAAAG
jgi:hypothetical protein